MDTYKVTITGKTALLMHNDDVEWSDILKGWRKSSENKAISVPGDDRSPAFTWLGSLYHDGVNVVIPSSNLMKSFMQAGAGVPTGKGTKTFKAQTQSGMVIAEEAWPIIVDKSPIEVQPLLALKDERDFSKHVVAARASKFLLHVKRAPIGSSKHVRVRPRFDGWSASGTLQVWDGELTPSIVEEIVRLAGDNKGVGDWRPSSPKSPGPFGRFDVKLEKIKRGGLASV